MKYGMNHLSLAVRLALTAGILAAAGVAQAQTPQADNPPSSDQATPPSKSKAKTLQAVVVTGSLIRRVDAETASPVVTLDRATISNSGSLRGSGEVASQVINTGIIRAEGGELHFSNPNGANLPTGQIQAGANTVHGIDNRAA